MEQVRFAVVGTKSIGKYHIEGIQKSKDAVLTAVCEIREDVAIKTAEKNGLDRYFTDYDEMLKVGGFDCVVICTPDQCHTEQAVKALEAGYHVLCEKPLAMKHEECQQIVDAAKKSDKLFMVGQVCRYTPSFLLMKQMVERGDIGEVFYVESEYAHDYSIIKDAEWRKDPVYLREPVIGGGCHAMDLLRWIVGDPTEVFAYANRKSLTDWPVNDCTISVLKYPNDVIGKVLVSIGCKRPYTMRTQIFGTKGTLLGDNTSSSITLYKAFEYADTGKIKYLPTEVPVVVNNHNMVAEIQDMCDVILGRKPLEIDAVQGANTVAVCRAAVDSVATGLPVKPKYFH